MESFVPNMLLPKYGPTFQMLEINLTGFESGYGWLKFFLTMIS